MPNIKKAAMKFGTTPIKDKVIFLNSIKNIAKIVKKTVFLQFLGHGHHLVFVLLGSLVDRFETEFSLILGSKSHEQSIKNQ